MHLIFLSGIKILADASVSFCFLSVTWIVVIVGEKGFRLKLFRFNMKLKWSLWSSY